MHPRMIKTMIFFWKKRDAGQILFKIKCAAGKTYQTKCSAGRIF